MVDNTKSGLGTVSIRILLGVSRIIDTTKIDELFEREFRGIAQTPRSLQQRFRCSRYSSLTKRNVAGRNFIADRALSEKRFGMTTNPSWSVKGIEPSARAAAKAAAKREGLTLGAWLSRAIARSEAAYLEILEERRP